MPDETITIRIEGQDSLSAPAQKASAALAGLQRSATQTHSSLAQIAKSAAGVAAGMLAAQVIPRVWGMASEAIIGFNASMEQARIGWGTLLKSTEAGAQMLAELQSFAATTPFEFPELEASAKRMLAMGFAAQDILPMLTDVGDAAAALGAGSEGIQRMVYALGQMSTKGKITQEDLNQLADVGINVGGIFAVMATQTNQSVGALKDMQQEGTLASDAFIRAFRTFAQQNYGGMMQAQSRTFNGAISTIKDNLRLLTSDAFQPVFAEISRLTLAFADLTSSADLAGWVAQLKQDAAGIYSLATDIGASFEGVAPAIGQALSGLWAAAEPFIRTLVDNVIIMVSGLIGWWDENLPKLIEIVTTVWAWIEDLWAKYGDSVLTMVDDFFGVARRLFGAGMENLSLVVDAALAAIRGDWKAVIKDLNDVFVNGWNAILENAGAAAKAMVKLFRIIKPDWVAVTNMAETGIDAIVALGKAGLWVKDAQDSILQGYRDAGATAVKSQRKTWDDFVKIGQAKLGEWQKTVVSKFKMPDLSPEEEIRLQKAAGDAAKRARDALAKDKANKDAAAAASQGLKKAQKDLGLSTGEYVQALVATHPAMVQVVADQKAAQAAVDATKLAIIANQDQLKAAQAEYARMGKELKAAQDVYDGMAKHLADLNEQLDAQKQKLSELANTRLIGMRQYDEQIGAVERQLRRLQLAELGLPSVEELQEQAAGQVRKIAEGGTEYTVFGISTEEAEAKLEALRQGALAKVMAKFPEMTEDMKAYLATLPLTSDGLQKVLEELQLTQGLKFDEALQRIKEAAEGIPQELSFEDAIAQIASTRESIASLTQQITDQEAAMAAQQQVIDNINASMEAQQALVEGIQAAGDALNETLADQQAQLDEVNTRQQILNDLLTTAYSWFVQDRDKVIELGGAAVQTAADMDVAVAQLLTDVTMGAENTNVLTSAALAALKSNLDTTMNAAKVKIAEVDAALKAIPRDITTVHHIVTSYETAGSPPSEPAAAPGGGNAPTAQHGLSFVVGGSGGVDSQLVRFWASPGERVMAIPPGESGLDYERLAAAIVRAQRRGAQTVNQTINNYGGTPDAGQSYLSLRAAVGVR